LLVFDITRRTTFESATSWLNDLRQIADEDIVVILVGNKRDLADQEGPGNENRRAVTQEEAVDWCRREGVMRYVETSAKSGEGVERAFLEVAERIYQNIEAGKYDLNDRRSGVKGYGTCVGRDGGQPAQPTLSLGMNDAMKGGQRPGCC
jgi:Ras-related protein Rab-2A